MDEVRNSFGNVYISHRAIASIAYQSALESYGVVGMAAKNLAAGLSQILIKDPTMGVEVIFDGKKLKINLFIIIEYGTRLSSVASSVADNVRFQVEKATALPVDSVNVHVRGLRISYTD
jgi:uncharacterized alkaline shock family protein YloU